MEKSTNPQKALADLQIAVKFHPDDALIQSALAQLLDSLGRQPEGKSHHDAAAYVAIKRIPADERGWSAQTCSYTEPA
jgi:hypothetical protein